MRNYFTLNSRDSRDFGVYINGEGTFSSPARRVEMIPVRGRNGDLVGMDTSFENGVYTYRNAFIYSNFETQLAAFRAFLNSLFGYVRLTDTYHPNEFRLVVFKGPFEPTVQPKNNAGMFDIEFNAKPQRFLTSGETVTAFTQNGTIQNPTLFDSKPLLRVYGAGIVRVNGTTITISENASYIDIDCDMMDCFRGAVNCNRYVSFSGYNFPVLRPGNNSIQLANGVTRVEITPRWWTI